MPHSEKQPFRFLELGASPNSATTSAASSNSATTSAAASNFAQQVPPPAELLDQLRRLLRSSFDRSNWGTISKPTAQLGEPVAGDHGSSTARAIVALEAEKIAGGVLFRVSRAEGVAVVESLFLAVGVDMRGKGVASALVGQLEKEGATIKGDGGRVFLCASVEPGDCQKFWERQGLVRAVLRAPAGASDGNHSGGKAPGRSGQQGPKKEVRKAGPNPKKGVGPKGDPATDAGQAERRMNRFVKKLIWFFDDSILFSREIGKE